MNENKHDGKFGYQPQKETRGYQPKEDPKGGYQPAQSGTTQPPNKGSSVQPAPQEKEK